MRTYYITDRTQFKGSEAERRSQLLLRIRTAAAAGVDAIQLREKDLPIRELESLAREVSHVIRSEGATQLLINHRSDVALAVGADGVHLTGSDVSPADVRALVAKSPSGRRFLIAVSCHSAAEVRLAEAQGADFAVLAPIFEKVNVTREGIGLEELRRATQKDTASSTHVEASDRFFSVFALGGVNLARAALCAAAGASGVAGIRLFQQSADLPALVRALRSL